MTRRIAALVLMIAGVVALSAGAFLVAGLGAALLVAGGSMAALSLAVGWGA